MNRKQSTPDQIWNICIVAHVDHGKTTFTDSILAEKGIITKNSAGVRYLDSREDEQDRGITIESSVATIHHGDKTINIIDSPGHVDFGGEVKMAADLCDGCFVLVDVIDGVGAQTRSVLQQIIKRNLTPILVLNKIDKLILDVKISPEEATCLLERIIGEVNGVYCNITNSDEIFSPIKNNVLFCSSLDGWAFTLNTISEDIERRIKIKVAQFLWGEYYYDKETKRIFTEKTAKKKGLNTKMFSLFVLEAIWRIYNEGPDISRRKMMEWLPLGKHILSEIPGFFPSANVKNKEKLLSICCSNEPIGNIGSISRIDYIKDNIKNEDFLLCVTRLLHGAIKKGDEITVARREKTVDVTVTRLYTFLGKDIQPVAEVEEGEVFGFYSQDIEAWWRGSIVCSDISCIENIPDIESSAPVINVIVEGCKLKDKEVIVKGLKMLCCVDTSAVYDVNEYGEDLLWACGEMHLKKCLWDLENIFSIKNISVSEPIVSFRETITTYTSVHGVKDDIEIEMLVTSFLNSGDNKDFREINIYGDNSICVAKGLNTSILTDNCLVNGFWHAVRNGPLFGEQLSGICFLVNSIISPEGDLKGKHIGFVRDTLWKCFLKNEPRILFAIYKYQFTTTKIHLGNLNGVISKRKGWIVSENNGVTERDSRVTAKIPVVESFGLSDELRSKCRGDISISLEFDGYKLLDWASGDAIEKYFEKNRGRI
eukprot:GHVP01056583.1.p1 GENE.GHVP01056583.1~~GHVP01056583.1.p1  ORF type:complete len:709 (+),score=116.59 GHVP01056583.1:253-2379(+)